MTERTQRRLAAIVAADVAGFSRLIGDDEEGKLRALRSHRGELLAALRPGFVAGHRLRCAALAQGGRIAEAQAALVAVRKLQPNISVSLLRRTLPYSSSEYLEKFVGGLRMAGLQE